jgi:hypothetical protein
MVRLDPGIEPRHELTTLVAVKKSLRRETGCEGVEAEIELKVK